MKFTSKILLIACASFYLWSLPVEAMLPKKGDDDKSDKNRTIKSLPSSQSVTKELSPKDNVVPTLCRFEAFKGLQALDYIKKCYPNVTKAELVDLLATFVQLFQEGRSPIQEDDVDYNSFEDGKPRSEAGYSFPPIFEAQGPFLHYCGTGSFKHVLDIGSGLGDDTIPFLLTRNVQVVAVDIHSKQLKLLKERVARVVGQVDKNLVSKFFGSFKRDFADPKAVVPTQYLGKFQGVNLNKVVHFLSKTQFETMAQNVASMLCEGGILSLTVSTYLPGMKEENWIKKQAEMGLEDPGIVYYKHVRMINPNDPLAALKFQQSAEYILVQRKGCKLPGPGYKIEESQTDKRTGIITHTIINGRYFHTLESLRKYLDPYFDILDHTVVKHDAEDVFLSVIARKKSKE